MRNCFAPTALFFYFPGLETTAADSYGALAMAWNLPAANAACLKEFATAISDGQRCGPKSSYR